MRGIDTPSTCLTCEKPMMIAAAAVKPTSTECDRKFTTKPSRPKPQDEVDDADHEREQGGGADVAGACPVRTAARAPRRSCSDTIATGPTASWRDVPNTAYTRTGTIEA